MWCDVCGGSGEVIDYGASTEEFLGRPAPKIGCERCGGSGLDPERLERAAKGAFAVVKAGRLGELLPEWDGLAPEVQDDWRGNAAAAITEYLRKD